MVSYEGNIEKIKEDLISHKSIIDKFQTSNADFDQKNKDIDKEISKISVKYDKKIDRV